MENEHIKLKEKIGYGLGDAASSMFWKLFTMYLLFFLYGCDRTFGCSGRYYVFGYSYLGYIFGSFYRYFGRSYRKPLGKIPTLSVVGGCSVWNLWNLTFSSWGESETAKIVYAYVTYTLMMMIYSLINVPYASLLGVMSVNPQTRTEFSSYRMTFLLLGGSILVLALVEPLTDFFSRMKLVDGLPSMAFGWQMAAVVFAVMATCMFLLTFLWTKERIRPILEKKKFSEK